MSSGISDEPDGEERNEGVNAQHLGRDEDTWGR